MRVGRVSGKIGGAPADEDDLRGGSMRARANEGTWVAAVAGARLMVTAASGGVAGEGGFGEDDVGGGGVEVGGTVSVVAMVAARLDQRRLKRGAWVRVAAVARSAAAVREVAVKRAVAPGGGAAGMRMR